MIPVALKPEPPDFDVAVRQKGLRWLRKKKIPLHKKLPAKTVLYPYWRAGLKALHESYDGVCAYLAVYLEHVTGASSVDHFVAKSKTAGLAYEWANYRLACRTMNARKCDFDTVLDPIGLTDGTFRLVLLTGEIYPNPNLSGPALKAARDTIDILGLDDKGCRKMRAKHYLDFVNRDISAKYLKEYSPFVYCEAERQGLL